MTLAMATEMLRPWFLFVEKPAIRGADALLGGFASAALAIDLGVANAALLKRAPTHTPSCHEAL